MSDKSMGQVFTPPDLAAEILDRAGYTVDHLLAHPGKWDVLEPSFGQGVFLAEIVRRMVTAGDRLGMDPEELARAVDQNLFGVELDGGLFEQGRHSARRVFSEATGADVALPGLVRGDALDHPGDRRYSHIVGNPPYVRVHHMDEATLKKVRRICPGGGMGELYVAFFAAFLPMLTPDGRLVFITPNSWIRNTGQTVLRGMLLDGGHIEHIVDHGSEQMFEDAATYTAITTLTPGGRDTFTYTSGGVDTVVNCHGDRPADNPLISRTATDGPTLAGLALIRNGLATQADRVFIRTPEDWLAQGVGSDLLIPAVKAGRLDGVDRMVLAPYHLDGDRPVGLTENELETFPDARDYLERHRGVLSRRARDRTAAWFHFGRSQALSTITRDKIALSVSVPPDAKRVSWRRVPAGTAVYSGLVVTAIPGGPDLGEIARLLDAEDFYDHCRREGKPISGGWVMISAPVVKRYTPGADACDLL